MFMRNITLFLFWWFLFFSISTSSADNEINLDIDENGEYDALSDGLLIIRYLFGLTGDDLVSGILGSNSLVVEPIEIKSKLDSMRANLDVDGNGSVDALTDGLLILRYLFGLRGDSLVTQVIGTGAARNSSESIEDYVKSIMPSITLIEGNRGSGVFSFRNSQVINGQTINVFCHIPDSVNSSTPILFVFHGGGRNASDYRNAFVEDADEKGFIVIAPEFSSSLFPGGDGYNLGNVFVDGDNPTSSSLNDESEWLFSVIEPLYDFVKVRLENTTSSYSIFGFSAGGQVAHRMLFFKPHARVDHYISSGSGWYTTMNNDLSFPYGFKNSPLENSNFESHLGQKMTILIGDQDNDPNAASLRRNNIVDQQGRNRFDRAIYFYEGGRDLAEELQLEFNWSFEILENTAHDYVAASRRAAQIIFADD